MYDKYTETIDKIRSRDETAIRDVRDIKNEKIRNYLALWIELFFEPKDDTVSKLMGEHSLPQKFLKLIKEEIAVTEIFKKNPSKALSILGEIDESKRGQTYWARVGNAQILLSNNMEAYDAYTRAYEINPLNADVINNLAGCYARLGNVEKAIEKYNECLQINPVHVQALISKQKIEQQTTDPDAYITEQETKHKDSGDVNDILALFNAYISVNDENNAVEHIKRNISDFRDLEKIDLQNEDDLEGKKEFLLRAHLARYFFESHQHRRALAVLNQIGQFSLKMPRSMAELKVKVLIELDRLKAAHNLLEEYCDDEVINNDVAQLLNADLLIASGREAEVETALSSELSTPALDAKRMATIRHAKMLLGEFDEILVDFDPENIDDYQKFINAINTKKFVPSDDDIKKAQAFVDNPLARMEIRQNLAFAIASTLEKKKRFSEAMHCLNFANGIDHKRLKYSAEDFTAKVEDYINYFTQDVVEGYKLEVTENFTPIFIVGMPRSGTTLTETILGTHSEVSAAGELPYIPRNIFRAKKVFNTEQKYPYLIDELPRKQLRAMANAYYAQVPDQFKGTQYIVDKLPHNFMNVGLISILFPRSPIIHVQRHPIDCALSNYQQNFKAKHGMLGYSANLSDMALHFNDYGRLMRHWRALDLNMLEVKYEDVIENMEPTISNVLKFIGINWEVGLGEFHRTKRSVKTASVAQVRQPIYRTSSQKWRNYEEHMSEFTNKLDMSLFDY